MSLPFMPSARAQIITRRSYNRPLDDNEKHFETWDETVSRVISHQAWLWKRAKGSDSLNQTEWSELAQLSQLMRQRMVFPAGRTLWLGGTEIARQREASMFNCAFLQVNTVSDVVDSFWLLLQGCGVGFEPVTGTLTGFSKPVEVQVIRSNNLTTKGREHNVETHTKDTAGRRIWTVSVGDSAEAWAKSVGKILACKRPVDVLVLDFSQIRAPGIRLRGYGWISSGDITISAAFVAIAKILNQKAGQILNRIDLLDIMNHLGTCLSSRRSAEIALCPVDDPESYSFANAKREYWLHGNDHRQQSNNSLLFDRKPSRFELRGLIASMIDAGGSEPGFINTAYARQRAPWFMGVNPCAEILLGNKSFCNLFEIVLPRFNGDWTHLRQVMALAARANYRQTCVNLYDGILQNTWHEQNEQLRLTGVGLTGYLMWERQNHSESLEVLRKYARLGADSMADELALPRSKAVCTVKPSGTQSKIADVTEGAHGPLGRYILNNVRFGLTDPMLPALERAGYRVWEDPSSKDAMLVTLPAPEWGDLPCFDERGLNFESAVAQLNRYRRLMDHYVDHNCSVTISYSPEEAPAITEWLYDNWDHYVGVSFLFRSDPTKTAEDLGFSYLPQQVVNEDTYRSYVQKLSPVELDSTRAGDINAELETACSTGACPIR